MEKDEYAKLLHNREIVFACDHECFLLSSEDGISTDATPLPILASSQEEADTLIILHSLYADHKETNEDASIVIHSPDTDVFILLLTFCHKFCHPLYFDTGSGNKRRILHIQTLCVIINRDILDSLLGLHAFTGCDVNSAFVQKGKIKPLNILLKNQEFTSVFKELGQSSEVSENILIMLEKFMCYLYGKPKYTSTSKLWYNLVRQKYLVKGQCPLSSLAGFDISLLPPCKEALKNHILRANYQSMIWKQADNAQPDIPDPVGYGWVQDTNGILSIEWCTDLLPQQLADIVFDTNTSFEDKYDDENQTTSNSDYDDITDSDSSDVED